MNKLYVDPICHINDNKSVLIQNIQLQEQINQYKQTINKLQIENSIIKQKQILCTDLLLTNTRTFKEELLQKQKEIDTLKLLFEQNEHNNITQYNNKLNVLKAQMQTQTNTIQQQQETILKMERYMNTKTSKYTDKIKSLKNVLNHNNMETNELEQINQDLRLIYNEQIKTLKYQIKSKDAEIHSLQMITPVKSYDININNPYNYRRKRSSGIRKISVSLDTIDANIRSQSSRWKQSESTIIPYYMRHRTNNESISVSSPSADSLFDETDNSYTYSLDLNCCMQMESKGNKRTQTY